MQLYLIRHGQSTNNALGDDQSQRVYDPPLTTIGYEQAQCAAQYLATAPELESYVLFPNDAPQRNKHYPYRIQHLYCSAMHRAIQTAYPIAQALGLNLEIWTDIHEHGGIYLETDGVIKAFGGRTRSQIVEEFPECVVPDTITESGWWNPELGMEDFIQCNLRADRVAQSLRQRALQNDESIALVTHGTFMDRLIKNFLGYPTEEGTSYHWHNNTGITRIDINQKGLVFVRYINRVNHLSPQLIT